MDCSKTVEFMKEKERMCKALDCDVCPIGSRLNEDNCICDYFIQKHIEKAIKIVQKWSDEHPLEIDWVKVPVDTPVLVWDTVGAVKKARYFAMYMPAAEFEHKVFDCGDKRAEAGAIVGYRHCELAPEVDPTPYCKDGE